MRRLVLTLAMLGCVSTTSAVASHSLVALANDGDDGGRRFLRVCAVLASLAVACAEAGYGLAHAEPLNDGGKS